MRTALKKASVAVCVVVIACVALLVPGFLGGDVPTELATQPAPSEPSPAPVAAAPIEVEPTAVPATPVATPVIVALPTPTAAPLSPTPLPPRPTPQPSPVPQPTAVVERSLGIEGTAVPVPTEAPEPAVVAVTPAEPTAETVLVPTPTVEVQPEPTASVEAPAVAATADALAEPTPTLEPDPTPTPDPTATPDATPTPEPTAEPTPEATTTVAPTAEPTVEPTVDPTTEPATGIAPAWMWVESTDGLFLRDAPGGQIVTVLNYRDQVYVNGEVIVMGDRLWVSLDVPQSGWVALSFLVDEEPARPSPDPSGEPTGPIEPPTAADWAAMRQCESGGRYDAVDPSGLYHGAYQFLPSTWDGLARRFWPELVGVLPSQAAPADQDKMAAKLFDLEGASPWPTCGIHLR